MAFFRIAISVLAATRLTYRLSTFLVQRRWWFPASRFAERAFVQGTHMPLCTVARILAPRHKGFVELKFCVANACFQV